MEELASGQDWGHGTVNEKDSPWWGHILGLIVKRAPPPWLRDIGSDDHEKNNWRANMILDVKRDKDPSVSTTH